MKAVKRVVVVDPDTGETETRVTVDSTSPSHAAAEAGRKMMNRKGVDAQLRLARGFLAEIVGTPEHDRAKEVLDRSEAERALTELAWHEFCALYERAKRRMVARKIQSDRVAGTEQSVKVRKENNAVRNAKIVADSPWHTRADLAKKYKLSERRIRTILKEAEKN